MSSLLLELSRWLRLVELHLWSGGAWLLWQKRDWLVEKRDWLVEKRDWLLMQKRDWLLVEG